MYGICVVTKNLINYAFVKKLIFTELKGLSVIKHLKETLLNEHVMLWWGLVSSYLLCREVWSQQHSERCWTSSFCSAPINNEMESKYHRIYQEFSVSTPPLIFFFFLLFFLQIKSYLVLFISVFCGCGWVVITTFY